MTQDDFIATALLLCVILSAAGTALLMLIERYRNKQAAIKEKRAYEEYARYCRRQERHRQPNDFAALAEKYEWQSIIKEMRS